MVHHLAIITGATRGIGASIANIFADAGMSIVGNMNILKAHLK